MLEIRVLDVPIDANVQWLLLHMNAVLFVYFVSAGREEFRHLNRIAEAEELVARVFATHNTRREARRQPPRRA